MKKLSEAEWLTLCDKVRCLISQGFIVYIGTHNGSSRIVEMQNMLCLAGGGVFGPHEYDFSNQQLFISTTLDKYEKLHGEVKPNG